MKDKLKKFVPILFIIVIGWGYEYYFWNIKNISWDVPLLYSWDGITCLVNVSSRINNIQDLLGWPIHSDASKFSACYDLVYRLEIFIISLVNKNPATILNISILVIPIINSLSSYYMMIKINISKITAVLASLCFGFCHYIQFRISGHLFLAQAEGIPLFVLMCFWIIEKDDFLKINRKWYKNYYNWLSILFCWIISNTGMIYYPFFCCFFLCILLLIFLLNDNYRRYFYKCIILVGEIVFFVVLAFVPTFIGIIKGYGLGSATGNAIRTIWQGDVYNLRISSLILSPKGYGIKKMAEAFNDYFAQIASVESIMYNENTAAYLGIIGVIGFFALFIFLFISKKFSNISLDNYNRIKTLSQFNVAAIFLSAISGIGSIIAIYFRYIRCYNRISIFICFFCILCIAIIIDMYIKKIAKKFLRVLIICVEIIVFCFSLWEQSGYVNFDFEGIKQVWNMDKKFVNMIEKYEDKNALIFQLPYMKTFENGNVNNMVDYELYRGPLHSNSLRWSYGGISGEENEAWYYETSLLDEKHLIDCLRENNFSGIYINLNGYGEQEGASVLSNLLMYSNCNDYIVSDDGKLFYIPIEGESENGVVVDVDDIELKKNNEYYLYSSDEFAIGTNEDYIINIELPENSVLFSQNTRSSFLDFYACDYDNPMQQIDNFVQDGIYTYSFIVNTGEIDKVKKIITRVVVFTDDIGENKEIKKLKVKRIKKINYY